MKIRIWWESTIALIPGTAIAVILGKWLMPDLTVVEILKVIWWQMW